MTNSSASAQNPQMPRGPQGSADPRLRAWDSALGDVAVLLPAYNGQADVDRTLASFSEDDALVHVLIVDDGSTPPIVAPALPNLTIEVLRMPQNGGIEKALQTGIDALAGRGFRYAARIDAGDLSVPHRLAKQRAYLEANPQVAGLGMWTQVVTRDGKPLFMLTPPAAPTRSAACAFTAVASRTLR
jgi:glycosyltransferase involved in cell wall biosynthesis